MQANQDMIDGYRDGRDPHNPEPSGNRSRSYRHGFANGRDDLNHTPRASAEWLRQEADRCIIVDSQQESSIGRT